MSRRAGVALLNGALFLLLLGASFAPSAQAAEGPRWHLESIANTNAAIGSTLTYNVFVTNPGDQATTPAPCPGAGCQALELTLPEGLTANAATSLFGDWECSLLDPHHVSCTAAAELPPLLAMPSHQYPHLQLSAEVTPAASGTEVAELTVSGGAAPAITIHDATQISAAQPPFGIDAFDGAVEDASGQPFTRASMHPHSVAAEIDFNRYNNPLHGALRPVAPVKDTFGELPPGLVGNATATATCTPAQLANADAFEELPLCPSASQLGVVMVEFKFRDNGGVAVPAVEGPFALFNMAPPPGVAARFGFQVKGTVITLDAMVRGGSDYGVTVASNDIPEVLPLIGVHFSFWGTPADSSHNSLRGCPGEKTIANGGPTCDAEGAPELPLLRNPTACTAPGVGLTTTIHADSWFEPGAETANGEPDLSDPAWQSASFVSHEAPGYPNPPSEWGAPIGPTGCESVPFTPEATVTPTTTQADSPSGLNVDLSIPQTCWGAGEAGSTCQSDLKKAVVALPQGMSVNPASADGLAACTSSQIGLLGTEFPAPAPIHFTDEAPNCPDASKIGSAEVTTPLLDHKIKAGVYLAAQGDNPFHSLLALYIGGRDPESGVVLKLPGRVEAKPDGQLVTTFDNQPQLPFETLHLELFGGSRAPLRTPSTCGTYTTQASLTPWSGNAAVQKDSSFEITTGPGGAPCPNGAFAPKLQAGTTNPLAATYSPFVLRLTREDGTRELTGLTATLPPGLIGKLAGIPYCPDSVLASIPTAEGTGAAQNASPSCPAASQVGTVTAGAGAGANPFYVSTGRAYLAGPYKGAPLSLAIVTPALAGPFDLGNVLVRTALNINETTTQITATSDPIPTILDGIPLDIRSLEVNMNRPSFTLNPTSCDEMQITGTATGVGGTSAPLADRFQVGNCSALPFKPKLTLSAKGGTKRSQFPAFSATLKMPAGGANIAKAAVTLPPALQIENAHINEPCTRVQFAANACPPSSVLGSARAFSPLLDQPLEGPVYFRSNGGEHLLPDIVADLRGQIHVVLVGHIDTVKNKKTGATRIRNTFETVPDAPVSKFKLSLFGGKRGYLVNNRNVCKAANKADVKFDAQNGKISDSTVKVANSCKTKGKHSAKKHRRARR